MFTPVTTKPSSIASRLRSFGVVHAALSIQSGEASKELDQRRAAVFAACKRFPVLAVSGDTPTDPTGLVAQVREIVGFLRHPKVQAPEVDLDGIALDPPTMAAQLASEADELDGVLVDVNEAEKQADVTRQAKNEAIGAYDRKFLRVARLAEALFHFAGLHELAERVRPSTRRPGRRLADEDSGMETGEARAEEAQADTAEEPETDASSADG